jgi:uncharacterized protein with PQ loop repeat
MLWIANPGLFTIFLGATEEDYQHILALNIDGLHIYACLFSRFASSSQIFVAEEVQMSSVSTPLFILSAFALACWVLLRQKRRQYKYPPGPSRKPIIGNALDVPTHKPWITYMKWSKELNSAFPLFS